jgi:hypothetical protein
MFSPSSGVFKNKLRLDLLPRHALPHSSSSEGFYFAYLNGLQHFFSLQLRQEHVENDASKNMRGNHSEEIFVERRKKKSPVLLLLVDVSHFVSKPTILVS